MGVARVCARSGRRAVKISAMRLHSKLHGAVSAAVAPLGPLAGRSLRPASHQVLKRSISFHLFAAMQQLGNNKVTTR